jgi:uncharacterized protein
MSTVPPERLGGTLLELQDLDSRIFSLLREIDGLPEEHRLAELERELKESREARAARKSELEDLEHRQHKLDGELDLLNGKIKEEEGKLFSGTIMNPKELGAIQAEIISLRKKSDDMETEDLEMMERIDAGKRALEESEEHARLVEEQERSAREAYNRELAEKESCVEDLERKRDGLKETVDPDLIEAYEKLLSEKGGLAVVRIDQGRNCGGCHVQFSRTQIDRFLHEEGIFRCEFCRRILVK